MLSLLILVGLLVASVLATAWAVTFAARRFRSPRARLRTGLLATLLILAIELALTAVHQLLPVTEPGPTIIAAAAILLLQLAAIFLVLRRAFALPVSAAFAPFFAYIAATIAGLVVTAFVVRPALSESFIMPTQSMSPTIGPADRFMVNKLITPRRWDLVAYHSTDPSRSVYCKRLIGLPGDRLRFEDGQLYVNDQLATPPAVLAGRLRASLPRPAPARYADAETIPLGPDEFFFVGDNIDLSGDSRTYGPSARSALVGVVDLFYWPPAKVRVVR